VFPAVSVLSTVVVSEAVSYSVVMLTFAGSYSSVKETLSASAAVAIIGVLQDFDLR